MGTHRITTAPGAGGGPSPGPGNGATVGGALLEAVDVVPDAAADAGAVVVVVPGPGGGEGGMTHPLVRKSRPRAAIVPGSLT
ncbi:hypothetical protein PV761_10835 [Arthrobacter sp. CC3]|uniref:hypothetical protein n=1 Tax=Arthrobacter sp. CC3 TaxID=3029185 RepID=UPI0032652086